MSVYRAHQLPRVLFASAIDPSQKYGTFEEQTFSLCKAFRDRSGFFLPLFLTELGLEGSTAYRDEGIRAESLDLRCFQFSTLLKLLKLVRREDIEVIHWNFYEPVKNGYVWALTCLAPSVRHFFTDHSSRPVEGIRPRERVKGVLKHLAFRRFERIFCVSDFVAESYRSGGKWNNVTRWTHLVNTERFSPSLEARVGLRDRYGVSESFVALVVANLTPEKGVDVAIRALTGLPESAILWVVGEGKERTRLESLTRDLTLGDRVRFFGIQRNVAPFMRAADCLVCPSVWAEAAGLANIEALACGLPVLGSRIGGIPEIIEDGVNGVLFPPCDDRRLSQLFAEFMADPECLRIMGSSGRCAALDRFSIQNRIDDYIQYYETPGGDEHGRLIHSTA